MYVPKAVKDKSGSCYDVVYVALGGNDQLNRGCRESGLSDVVDRVTSVLRQVVFACFWGILLVS